MKENQLVVKQKPIIKVVILGDSNVGKSCLMNRFVSNSFSENTLHTLGVEFLQKELDVNGIVYTLQVKLSLFYSVSKQITLNNVKVKI